MKLSRPVGGFVAVVLVELEVVLVVWVYVRMQLPMRGGIFQCNEERTFN